MNTESLINIILAGIGLVGAIATYYLIPLIKTRLNAEVIAGVKLWAEIVVVAIEKSYEHKHGAGKEKKAIAIDLIKDYLDKEDRLSEDQIGTIVDKVVEETINAKNVNKEAN